VSNAEIFLCFKYLLSTVCWSLHIHRIKFFLCCLSRLDLHLLSVSTQYYCKITPPPPKKKYKFSVWSRWWCFSSCRYSVGILFAATVNIDVISGGRKNCCCPSVISLLTCSSSYVSLCISSHSDIHSHEIVKAHDLKQMIQVAVGNVTDFSERYICWFIENYSRYVSRAWRLYLWVSGWRI